MSTEAVGLIITIRHEQVSYLKVLSLKSLLQEADSVLTRSVQWLEGMKNKEV